MSKILTVTINPGLTIVGVLPDARPSTAYSFQLAGYGGTPDYTFSLVAGYTLPGTFDISDSGLVSGSTDDGGSFPFDVMMTDAIGRSVVRSFVLRVIPLPLQVSGSIVDASVGAMLSQQLNISGGVAPYHGALVTYGPAWLDVNVVDHKLSFTGAAVAGYTDSHVTVEFSDNNNSSGSFNVPFSWEEPYFTGDFANATVGQIYSSDIVLSGGNGVYENPRITSGTAPANLDLSIVTDTSGDTYLRLSGTSTDNGSHTFTVAADSTDGQTATSEQTVSVNTPPRMLIKGGRYHSYIYDPATGGITQQNYPSGMDQFRSYGGALVQTPNGRTFIIGGNGSRKSAELVSDAWEARADVPSTFDVCSSSNTYLASAIDNNKIVIVGPNNPSYTGGVYYARVAVYDVDSDSWTDLGSTSGLSNLKLQENYGSVSISDSRYALFRMGLYQNSDPWLLFDGDDDSFVVWNMTGIESGARSFIPSANGFLDVGRSSWREIDIGTQAYNSNTGSTGFNAGVSTRAISGDIITMATRTINKSSYSNVSTLGGWSGTTDDSGFCIVDGVVYGVSEDNNGDIYYLSGALWHATGHSISDFNVTYQPQVCQI